MVFILLFTSVSKCETFFPPFCVCNFVFIEVIGFAFLLPSTFIFLPNSSTNAYMLIYRLKDPSRNASKKFILLNLAKENVKIRTRVTGFPHFFFFNLKTVKVIGFRLFIVTY